MYCQLLCLISELQIGVLRKTFSREIKVQGIGKILYILVKIIQVFKNTLINVENCKLDYFDNSS